MKNKHYIVLGIIFMLFGLFLGIAIAMSVEPKKEEMIYRNDLQRYDAYPRPADADIISTEPLGEMYTWNYSSIRINKKYCHDDIGTAMFRESDGKFNHCFY